MAKRFVDTALGRKAWFRKLEPRLKCAWRFLTDECDNIGLWSIDLDSLEFHVGERVTVEEMLKAFNADEEVRLTVFQHDKLMLPGFVNFQYGNLSPGCKSHQPILQKLEEMKSAKGVTENPKGVPKGFQPLMEEEEDMEEEMETDMETEEETETEKKKIEKLDFESAYRRYPRKEGKSKGIKKLKSEIKSSEDFEKLVVAIENYAMSRRGQDPQFTKHFSTFVSEWRDWIDYRQSDSPPTPTPNNPAYRRMAGNQAALAEALRVLEVRHREQAS